MKKLFILLSLITLCSCGAKQERTITPQQTSFKEEVQEDVEELKKAHPLVRDERLFNLNYWPDVVPVCFEEEGEQEV